METMTAGARCHEVSSHERDRPSAWALFDSVTRESLGMSGEDFLVGLDSGKYECTAPDEVPGLVDVLMALPFAR